MQHRVTRSDHSWTTTHDWSPAQAEAMLEFGRFRVLLRRRQLLADGVPVELGTRAFDLLMVLIEVRGRLVSKDELLSRVWPNTVVGENNLQVQISALRKVLGKEHGFIRTEFGRGYRFTGEVRSTHGSPDGLSLPDAVPAPLSPNAALPTSATLSELGDNRERLAELFSRLGSHQVVVLTFPPDQQSPRA